MTPINSKVIPGYDGFYRADLTGRLWTCRKNTGRSGLCNSVGVWKELHPTLAKSGYLFVTLCGPLGSRTCRVHRLVLETFVGPRPKGMECRHFPDRNKSNNRPSNLSWGTKSQNMQDRVVHGTDSRGEKHGRAKLSWKKVRKIRKLYIRGKYGQRKLAKRYGVALRTISTIVHNLAWKE